MVRYTTQILLSFLMCSLCACGTSNPGNIEGFTFDVGQGLPTGDTATGASDVGKRDTGAPNPDGTTSGDSIATDAGATTKLDVLGATDAGPLSDVGASSDTWGADTGSSVGNTQDAGSSDVPWGSAADATTFDAGQFNYNDVTTTGGKTGSGGAGLCIPKISQLNLEEIKKGGKVDIIWWIDTSGSMGQEAKYLNQNLNSFASFIAGTAIDFRVILIGKTIGSIKVCVGPPLGGVNCSGGPKFLPVQEYISSKNGLDRIIQTYPKWKSFLRQDAVKNFVAVTDDNSYKTANWFIAQLQTLDAVQFKKTKDVPHGFVNHSIVGYPSKSQCSTLASVGSVYLDLTAKTKGEKFKICETNWAPIFQKLAKSVISTVKPPCNHKIPMPVGVSSAKGVTVNYVAEDDFFNVPPATGNVCPGNGVGYTVDNLLNPKQITLCNKSCNLLNGGGNIQFDFGCFL